MQGGEALRSLQELSSELRRHQENCPDQTEIENEERPAAAQENAAKARAIWIR
jgi:hypothetical protein